MNTPRSVVLVVAICLASWMFACQVPTEIQPTAHIASTSRASRGPGTRVPTRPERRHIPLEEILFEKEEPIAECPQADVLPAVPRDFERPDFLDPLDPQFDPDSPFASFAAFLPIEITDPQGSPDGGPFLSTNGEYFFTQVSFEGPFFRSLEKGTPPPSPYAEIACAAEVKHARLTAQIWIPGPNSARPLPQQIRDPRSRPLALVAQHGGFADFVPTTLAELRDGPVPLAPGEDPENRDERALLGRALAKQGILFVRYKQGEAFPDPMNPGPNDEPIFTQFGFGENGFAVRTRKLLMSRNPDGLSVRDLRLDFRYGLAQSYLISKTFLQHYLVEKVASASGSLTKQEIREWIRDLAVVYSGSSKGGAAALTAAGADDNAVGLDSSGFSGFDAGPDGALRRYLTDWCEVANQGPVGLRNDNKNADFVNWVYLHRIKTPSYAESYLPSRDPDTTRYADLLVLDTVSTHDHNWPLLSTQRFWNDRDGLEASGAPDPNEEEWRSRHLRQPNLGHGFFHRPFPSVNPQEFTSRLLLVYGAMLKLQDEDRSLPSLELVGMDTPASCVGNCSPGQECWSIRTRISDLGASHTAVQERFRLHLLLSDDRDTRRFDCDGRCPAFPLADRVVESQRRSSIVHDTIDEEDYFLAIAPVISYEDENGDPVDPNGLATSYRRLSFCPPAEYSAFSNPPMIVATVELFVDQVDENGDPNDEVGLGDASVFSDLGTANADAYPPEQLCEPQNLQLPTVLDLCPDEGVIGTRVDIFGTDFTPDLEIVLVNQAGQETPVDGMLISREILQFSLPNPGFPNPIPPFIPLTVCVRKNGQLICGDVFRLDTGIGSGGSGPR